MPGLKKKVSHSEDKLRYCQLIYSEARKREQDLRDVNLENRMFFEGKDEILTKRKQNSRVERSSIFVHELTPAIETRIGEAISRLKENVPPLVAHPVVEDADDQQKEQAAWIATSIYEQMMQCGYMPGGFREHILAAEIQRSPAALKVYWEEETEKIPEVVKRPIQGKLEMFFPLVFRREVVFRKESGGRPTAQYLWPEEFLYEPHISRFQRDSDYAIHAMWLRFEELMNRAKEFGYSITKINSIKEELQQIDTVGDTRQDSARDELAELQGIPIEPGYQDGKYLLCENYILNYDDSGNEHIDLVVTVGNKEIVYERRNYYRGLRYPFVLASANPMPGTLECLSSIDKAKPLQRFHNESYNSFIDGLTYRIFPPFLGRTGVTFREQPIYGPGRFWWADDISPEAIRPLVENPGQLPDLTVLMDKTPEKIRNLINAQDITQGFQAQPYEKATSTRLRARGMERRSTPTYENYGRTIIEVAQMFLALNQQFAENATDFVVEGGIRFDVPALTRVTDPDQEKNDGLMLMEMAQNSPVYQSAAGLHKQRNIVEDIVRQFKRRNVDSYVPTEQEVEEQIAAQTQQAQAEQEQVAAEQEQAAVEQEQEAAQQDFENAMAIKEAAQQQNNQERT
jgi:hypothetical protein